MPAILQVAPPSPRQSRPIPTCPTRPLVTCTNGLSTASAGHGSSPPVPPSPARPSVGRREGGGKSRPSPAQSPTPIPCRVVAFWSLIPDLLSGGIPEEAHERTERGQGFVHHRGARHHESADNDHGGVSEANDNCWQQNPAEVQQNSSKWDQRIGWTVSKSTRVRWGTEFVHPTGERPLAGTWHEDAELDQPLDVLWEDAGPTGQLKGGELIHANTSGTDSATTRPSRWWPSWRTPAASASS
jgi:hypothetical protein